MKSCPFCGSKNVKLQDCGDEGAYVECLDCHASSPMSGIEESIKAWNTRYDPEEIPGWLKNGDLLRLLIEITTYPYDWCTSSDYYKNAEKMIEDLENNKYLLSIKKPEE